MNLSSFIIKLKQESKGMIVWIIRKYLLTWYPVRNLNSPFYTPFLICFMSRIEESQRFASFPRDPLYQAVAPIALAPSGYDRGAEGGN